MRKDLSSTSNKSSKSSRQNFNLYFGRVVSNEDDNDMMRLRVRIDGIDNDITDENLPYSLPLLPKFFYIVPKVGEAVKVFLSDLEKPYNMRYWMGSVISQPQFYSYDPYFYTALNGSDNQMTSPVESLKKTKDGKYLHPEKNDIGIIGRGNTDIIQKNKEIILRAGIHEKGNIKKLNRKNPGYIKLRVNDKSDLSYNMHVANRIGLMTHNGVRKYSSIMDDAELENFFDTAHPMVKGDLLVEFLNILRNVVVSHVHGGANTSANPSKLLEQLNNININKILSEYIRIN